MLAFWMMVNYRDKHNLNFQIVNQIHDAILLHVPVNEIKETEIMISETMGNIWIPMPDKNLKLDYECDILTRWGENQE